MKPKYQIGERVLVTHRTTMNYIDNERVAITEPLHPWLRGFIIGGVRRQLGKYERGSCHGGGYEPVDYDPPCLIVTGTIFVYQVRRWFQGRIIDVQPEHIKPDAMALDPPMTRGERILKEICDEVARAERLHGPINSLHEGYAIIAEELDEFWELVKLKAKDRDPVGVHTELIQTAAMCVRTLINVEAKAKRERSRINGQDEN